MATILNYFDLTIGADEDVHADFEVAEFAPGCGTEFVGLVYDLMLASVDGHWLKTASDLHFGAADFVGFALESAEPVPAVAVPAWHFYPSCWSCKTLS